MGPGDICRIAPGVYRESIHLELSGTEQRPVQYIGATDEDGNPLVAIDGTEPITGNWRKVEVNGTIAYSIPHEDGITQLFWRDRPMTGARWPDQPFERIWDRSTWAKGDPGGYKGRMISREIADTGIDWTGAMAVLNVGHQFKTWVRKIENHAAGQDTFHYRLEERMGNDKEDGPTWGDDRFYVFGKLECLSTEQEWFYDETNRELLFIPPGNKMPRKGEVSVKTRDYGMYGSGLQHVQISGISFHGCTFNFADSDHLVVENCHVIYPNFSRMLYDTQSPENKRAEVQTSVTGNANRISRVWIAYGNTAGIQLVGRDNVIENSIIHDVCWEGNISHPGILLNGGNGSDCNSRVSNCTIFNVGNVGIRYGHRNNIIEYNHIYNTGLACKDIAAIHTGSPDAFGSVARYNWVHDSMGKGIRGDDQTRGLTFHHNVVWNCDEGMILKGDFNKCYNNTVVGVNGHGCLIIPTRPEPEKWWAKAEFLEVQNMNSVFCNNLVESIVYRNDPLPDGHSISHNVELAGSPVLAAFLEAVDARDFARAGGLVAGLIRDSGRFVEGVDIPFTGQKPDSGAYQLDGDIWIAGADWSPPGLGFELQVNAEVARSWQLPVSSSTTPVPLPGIIRESQLSPASLKKLQALFDTCWSAEEVRVRREAIRERNALSDDSPEYRKYQGEVSRLHQQANDRLKKRAGEVLAGSELNRFHEIFK